MANEPYPLKLGSYARTITVAEPLANEWFQRGLNWMFDFHHEEAIKCFQYCLDVDPACVMAHWGIAYSNGPNYNFYKDVGYYVVSGSPDAVFPSQKMAVAALAKAIELIQGPSGEKYTKVEIALVEALRIRFSSWPPSKYASHLETAYRNAMIEVHTQFPGDPEVAFARVDATMVLKPWKLWDLKTGTATPEAEEIRPIIEASLLKWPQHPGLCHLYVHLMEMSPEPQAALPACDFLRSMNTDAGHLIHMATHIDVLVGDYRSGVDSNLKALQSDYRCINLGGGGNAGSFYAGYISHNCHMMVYSAMLGCMEDDAMKAASMVNDFMNEQLLTDFPQRQDHQECFYPQKVHVLLRFGRWAELLEMPFPKSQEVMCYTWATLLYARAISHAVMGNIELAKQEEEQFIEAMKHPAMKTRRLHNNMASDLLAVKARMLRGEILYRCGEFEKAYAQLRIAVDMEDALPYDEPWGIMQPCRHALGALLLEQNYLEEAAQVYKDDTMPGRHPENPWSLRGLLNCYEKMNETNLAKDVRSRLAKQQDRCGSTSKQIKHSCMCAGKPIIGPVANM